MILPACVSVHCLHAVPRGQERVEDPLELEKWAAVNRSLGDLRLRDLAASVSWALGLKACATLPSSACLMHSRGVPVSSCRKTGPESS